VAGTLPEATEQVLAAVREALSGERP
jgi:hypothetical protein